MKAAWPCKEKHVPFFVLSDVVCPSCYNSNGSTHDTPHRIWNLSTSAWRDEKWGWLPPVPNGRGEGVWPLPPVVLCIEDKHHVWYRMPSAAHVGVQVDLH